MFKIYDDKSNFYQWDLNQKIIVEDNTITEVHFDNGTDDCALVCEVYKEGGLNVANVPNILLQSEWAIRIYAVAADSTKYEERFKVCRRSKPSDYIYTETEVATFELLANRIDELETEGIAKAVEDYLVANPVEAGATAEQAAQIEQNAENISQIQASISGFATEEYVNNALAAIVDGDEVAY